MVFNATYQKVALFLILLFPILFIKQCDKRANHFFKDLPFWTCENGYYNIDCDESKRKVPNFEFINHNGDTISNESLEGRNYIINFFFTTCSTICPPITRNIKERIYDVLTEDQITILSFSIAEDNNIDFKEYAKDYNIDLTKNWHFLTGRTNDVRDFANGLSLAAGKDPSIELDGGFFHSAHIILVDENGFMRAGTDKKTVNNRDVTHVVLEEKNDDHHIHYTWDGSSSYEMRTLSEDIKQLIYNQDIPRKNED